MTETQAVTKWMGDVTALVNDPKRTEQLVSLLGSPGAVERFKTVALHSVIHDTGLQECDPLSVVEAIREAAVLSLDVYGPLGESWILPYKRTARLSIGYRGLLKLIRRSAQVSFVDAQVVYMQDEFDVQFGTQPQIMHRPLVFGERDPETKELLQERGNYRGAYAWAQLASSPHPLIEWMPLVDIEQIRKASPGVQAGRKTPWDNWYGEMARKSPLRRLAKRLPLDPVAERALAYESESDEIAVKTEPLTPAQSAARRSADKALAALPATVRGPEPVEPTPAAEPPANAEPTQAKPEADPKPADTATAPAAPKPAAVARPAAPADDDDADLAEMLTNAELGGEG